MSDVLMYILSKAEKHVHSEELVGTTACMMLKLRSHTRSLQLSRTIFTAKTQEIQSMGDSSTCVLYMGRPVSKG
jgi:hypothetical protein